METQNKRTAEIGALWLRQSARGEFLSGNITIDDKKIFIIVSPNTYKKAGTKQPDYRIVLSQNQTEPAKPAAPVAQPAAPQAKVIPTKPSVRKPFTTPRPAPAAQPAVEEVDNQSGTL